MAGRNLWSVPGNGILGGVTFGTKTSDSDVPHAEDESPWIQAFRQTWENQSGSSPDGSGYTAPYRPSQPTFGGASAGSTRWPPLVPSADFTPGQLTWPPFLPSVGSTSALAPVQNSSDFASKFAPLLPPDARAGGGPAMPQTGGWLNPSTPDQSSSDTGVVPVGYRIPTRARPVGPAERTQSLGRRLGQRDAMALQLFSLDSQVRHVARR